MSNQCEMLRALILALAGGLIGLCAQAQSITFSTSQPGAVDGPNGTTTFFSDSDIVLFNPGTGIGTIFLDDEVINDTTIPDMDALFVRADGKVIFSTKSGGAGFPFQDDQLVEYDPITDTLSVFYDFAGLITTNSDADIDAFHLLSNGNFLISNVSDFVLDSQSFEDGDIVEFDPVTQTASLLLSEDLFAGDNDIRVTSVSVLPNGQLLISAFDDDVGGPITLGGVSFDRGELVAYDLVNDVGSLFVDSSIFGGATEDFDAVHVIPLPAALWLLCSGIGILGWLRRAA